MKFAEVCKASQEQTSVRLLKYYNSFKSTEET